MLLLPIMPTTPFLLLAAFCYARGSERFYIWLLTNRWFGEYIRAWRNRNRCWRHPTRSQIDIERIKLVIAGTGTRVDERPGHRGANPGDDRWTTAGAIGLARRGRKHASTACHWPEGELRQESGA